MPEAELRESMKGYPRASIGAGTYGGLGIYAYDDGSHLTVGSYTSIGPEVNVLLGGEHRTDFASTYPFFAQEWRGPDGRPVDNCFSRGSVTIGSDVWIGKGATILSGTQIGHGAVIGAQSLVRGVVPPYEVWAGNPARHIRFRLAGHDVREAMLSIAWWNWPRERIERALPKLMSPDVQEFIDAFNRGEL